MKPAISLFLSIASLARVRSKSPKDMSHAARLALRLAAQAALGSSQAKLPKQWSLPRHLLNPCQANSWPLPADVPHHLDGCPAIALSKKKARKIKFFLHRCGTEKTKKSTKNCPLHGQDVEDC
ncbi:hypothetical protein ACFX2C_042757 [Malus domestica]